MEVKKKDSSSTNKYIKKILSSTKKIFQSKKIFKLSLALILIICIIGGFFAGLLVTGYFGTFDQPSGRAYKVLTAIGIGSLHDMKVVAQGIVRENIKIPYNMIAAQFSNPERLVLDIDFEDLQKIEFKRQQAIERGGLVTGSDDWVNAKLTHNDKKVDIKLRLKGDLPDHWSGDKWSFRIKTKNGDKVMGMPVFSIQDPNTRQEVNEWIYMQALKEEGLIGLRYQFVEVIINGENKGIYAMEEHFSKELIESNQRREGLIFKFEEDYSFKHNLENPDVPVERIEEFYAAQITTFENTDQVQGDPVKKEQFRKGFNLLEAFRNGDIEANQVFDKEKWAKYYAISTLLNCPHSKVWHNMRFYYNPITSKFEPIGFDGNCRLDGAALAVQEYAVECVITEDKDVCPNTPDIISNMILRDSEIYPLYIQELEKISNDEYIDKFLEKVNKDLLIQIRNLQNENFFYHFPIGAIYASVSQVQQTLSPVKQVNAFLEKNNSKEIVVSIANTQRFPIEIIAIDVNGEKKELNTTILIQPRNLSALPEYKKYTFLLLQFVEKDIESITIYSKIYATNNTISAQVMLYPYASQEVIEKDFIRQDIEPIKEDHPFLENDTENKIVRIRQGNWKISEDLIIPEGNTFIVEKGTTINLIDNAMILSYSKTQIIGTKDEPIRIYSSDETGQGVTVMQAQGTSTIKYASFENFTPPAKEGWTLTGGVNIFEANIIIEDSTFSNGLGEDTLNIIRSTLTIKNVEIDTCFSDCFDIDFGVGTIEDLNFKDCGNDCLDVSGSQVNITGLNIINVGDKGISTGEDSRLYAKDIYISGKTVETGLASKDKSELYVDNVIIENPEYCVVAYQKKAEFGPGNIWANNLTCIDYKRFSLIETESLLVIDGVPLLNKVKNVYDKLNGLEDV
jgi:hypothetical protein